MRRGLICWHSSNLIMTCAMEHSADMRHGGAVSWSQEWLHHDFDKGGVGQSADMRHGWISWSQQWLHHDFDNGRGAVSWHAPWLDQRPYQRSVSGLPIVHNGSVSWIFAWISWYWRRTITPSSREEKRYENICFVSFPLRVEKFYEKSCSTWVINLSLNTVCKLDQNIDPVQPYSATHRLREQGCDFSTVTEPPARTDYTRM